MLLAIDCGNTDTEFALWNGNKFCAHWRMATVLNRTGDEYFVWLKALMAEKEISDIITDVIICSTVARVVFNLRILANRYFGCRPLVVGKPDCALPIGVCVDAGTKVGPDRLANTAGGSACYGGNLIVVDFGTATNFDVIGQDGSYKGGVITPGVNLSLQALHHGAAALPHIDITRPEKVIGTNTIACMQSGIYWGYQSLISGIIEHIRTEYKAPLRVIATGGLAPLFKSNIISFDIIDLKLTMRGLVSIYNHNINKE